MVGTFQIPDNEFYCKPLFELTKSERIGRIEIFDGMVTVYSNHAEYCINHFREYLQANKKQVPEFVVTYQ